MKFRSKSGGRRKAAVERRFKLSRMASLGLQWSKRPKNVCFLLLVGALFFTAGPLMRYVKDHRYFALSEVEVKGTERLEVSGVRSWLGMVEGSSIWNASPRDLEENLQRHPAIAAAHVQRILPARLEVRIEEREPSVVIRDSRGFFLAAEDGILFAKANVDDEDLLLMPIVTVARGATADEVAPGKDEVSGQQDDALGDASLLSPRVLSETIQLAERLDAGEGRIGVSEVALAAGSPDSDGPEIVAFSEDGQLAVRLGWGDWGQKLDALSQVLKHAEATVPQGASPGLSGRLDVRDPEAVVAFWTQEGAV